MKSSSIAALLLCAAAFGQSGTPTGPSLIYSTFVSGGNQQAQTVAVDASGNVFVGAYHLLNKYDPSGNLLFSTNVAAGLNIYAIALDGAGNVYVSDENSASIDKFVPSGGSYTETNVAGGMYGAYLALDSHGNLAVATENNLDLIDLNYANFEIGRASCRERV